MNTNHDIIIQAINNNDTAIDSNNCIQILSLLRIAIDNIKNDMISNM